MTASPSAALQSDGPSKPPPKRGRKPDPSTEPNKSRDLQRLYRARRVQQLEDLQARVAFLEKENTQLRRRLGEDVPSPPAGPSPSHIASHGGSPAGSSLADSPAAFTPDTDSKPSLHLPFAGKPQIPGPEIDLSGVGRPPIGFAKAGTATIASKLSPQHQNHLVGQSPASTDAGSPSPWTHAHFNAAQNNLAAFGGAPQAVGTPGAGPSTPFSPADTVWGAEMLQAVQAQAFAAASSSQPPQAHQNPLLAGLHAHHPFAHHFPPHMSYSPAPRQVASPSASTSYDLPTPHPGAIHPSSPDLGLYAPYAAPSASSNTPASSSAYSPWPTSSLAAASPPTPPPVGRNRPFRPSSPSRETQRAFLQYACGVPLGELPPVGMSPTQMSPFQVFCLVLLRGLELTGKGRTQRVSWTAEEEQKLAQAPETEPECAASLLEAAGAIFEEEPSNLSPSAGFTKVSEAWQLLWTLPRNRFSPITLAESLLAAGCAEDQQRVGAVLDDAGRKVSWNVRCERGHGLLVREGALMEVKREVEEFAFGQTAQAQGQVASPFLNATGRTLSAGPGALGLQSQSQGDEYDPKAATMPWLQQHRP